MYQTPVPEGAVAPLVPQYPLSASTTRVAAVNAAQVPAGPPPSTNTSASRDKMSELRPGAAAPCERPTSSCMRGSYRLVEASDRRGRAGLAHAAIGAGGRALGRKLVAR